MGVLFAHLKNFLEKEMLNDEIVDEVRAIRRAHAAQFNYDLRAIYEDLKKSEAAHLADGYPFVEPPASPIVPNTALQRTRFAHR